MDATGINPKYKIRLFNTKNRPEDVGGTTNLPAGFDTKRLGWYELQPELSIFTELSISSRIDNGSIGNIRFVDDYKYLYTAEIMSGAYTRLDSPVSVDTQPTSNGSKILVYVDDNGDGTDCTGTVSISGTDMSDQALSEDITIGSNSGTYVSSNTFKTIDTDGITVTDVDSSCVITIFGDIGTEVNRREIQILCDTNDDDVYGLMFGGYISILPSEHRYNYTAYTGKLFDYTDYLKNNDYTCGYMTKYRCANYSQTGAVGACSQSSDGGEGEANWQVNCFNGDYQPSHPPFGDFTITDVPPEQYECGAYSQGTEILPFDGYTYLDDYYDDTSQYYKPHPYDYFDVMLALKVYLNNIETDNVVSRDYSLFPLDYGTITSGNGTMQSSDTSVQIENANGFIIDESKDYIAICENDLMEVTAFSGTGTTRTLTVTRDIKNVISQDHDVGTAIYILEAGNITDGMADLNNTLIQEPVYTSTVYRTGKSIAENLSYRFENETCVFWVDDYKQLHINVFDGANPGYSADLTFSETDSDFPILKALDISESDVINKVVSDVDTGNKTYRCQLNSSDISTSYGESVTLFGEKTGELQFELVNAVGETDYSAGRVGFTSHALRFLKKNSFPRFRQTLRFFGFVPAEHQWENAYDPLFNYTDNYNNHIDLRGLRCEAPDYHFDDKPTETFIIEQVKYVTKGYGVLYTDITMSRLSSPSDYGVI
jgi:hypothetical protein